LRIPINDFLAGLDHRPGRFVSVLVTLAIPSEAAGHKRVFSLPSKNAGARTGEDVPVAEEFAMRRLFPADRTSVLTR
jgi:hypothetical protein